jgi:hypothetical protein
MPRSGPFIPGIDPVPIIYEAGWARKISPLLGFDPRPVQPVASRYTDWSIPAETSNHFKLIVDSVAWPCIQ